MPIHHVVIFQHFIKRRTILRHPVQGREAGTLGHVHIRLKESQNVVTSTGRIRRLFLYAQLLSVPQDVGYIYIMKFRNEFCEVYFHIYVSFLLFELIEYFLKSYNQNRRIIDRR